MAKPVCKQSPWEMMKARYKVDMTRPVCQESGLELKAMLEEV